MSKRNLAIPDAEFAAISMKQCRQLLDAVGLKQAPYNLVFYELHDLLDWNETVRIGIKDFLTGWTVIVSDATLAERCGCSVNTIRKATTALCDTNLLIRQKVGKCFRYRIMRYDPMIEHLQENPPRTKKIEYVDDDDGKERTETKHTTRQNRTSNSANHSQKNANFDDNQDSSRYLPEPPTPGPTPEPAPPEVEVGKTDVNLPDPKPRPRPTTEHRTEEKAEQREETLAFFTSPSLELADKFAGDESEFTPDKLRQKRAHQFRDHLIKLFRAPRLAEDYPDETERLKLCTDVLSLYIDIVKTRDKPAEYVGFINTEPGMKALIQAQKQVFEGWVPLRKIELDDNLKAMWEQQYGENWREKREEMIRR